MGGQQRGRPLGGRTVNSTGPHSADAPREGSPGTVTPTAAEVAAAVGVAAGRERATLLLAGGRLVNVLTNEIYPADVLFAGRLIAGIFDPNDGGAEARRANAQEVMDLGGAYITPGLIDGHVHIESSLVSAAEYARGVLGRGVTGAVCDPHEVANVAGEPGVRWLLEATGALPFDVWVTVPSCVPSSPFETVGADFGLDAMERLMEHPRVVGVAELMSYPDVVAGHAGTLAKAYAGEQRGLPVEGHAPGLSGAPLQAYLASGVASDHEATVLSEGLAKLRSGAFLMVREGSVTRDLTALMPLVNERHGDRIGFVTDDRLPHDLLSEGAVELMVRRAIAAGVTPAYAVRCASYNIALHYRLPRRGAVAAGYFADVAVVPDLEAYAPSHVFRNGVLVAVRGEVLAGIIPSGAPGGGAGSGAGPTPASAEPGVAARAAGSDAVVQGTVHLSRLSLAAFELPDPGGRARCMIAIPNSILSNQDVVQPLVVDGLVRADPRRDLLKLACAERHGKHGRVGLGLVKGFGMQAGALATSVGHDHHNLMIAGVSDEDMLTAARRLEALGGGFVAVQGGRVLAELALPLAGLMTDRSLVQTRDDLDALDAAAQAMGCTLPSPYMALSFLGLAVVPELRLTDMGYVDVPKGRVVPFGVS